MNKTVNVRKMTLLAILAAIIVVLQCFCSVLTIPGLNVAITLTLVPILVGVGVYGTGAGAFLGAVFGIIVFIVDPTAKFLMAENFFLTAVLCIGKGVLAGLFAGLVYSALSKVNEVLGIIIAGIVAPVVNTGIFVLGMTIFFKDTIFSWAQASGRPSFLSYVILTLCGINFLVELVVNLALSTTISTIIKAARK